MTLTDFEHKFDPGYVLLSTGIQNDREQGLLVDPLLDRHCRGDWGHVSESVSRINEYGVDNDLQTRVHSSYDTKSFGTIWVITERHPALFDNAQTTFILKPEEYPPAQQ
jgi:hypothetical protein